MRPVVAVGIGVAVVAIAAMIALFATNRDSPADATTTTGGSVPTVSAPARQSAAPVASPAAASPGQTVEPAGRPSGNGTAERAERPASASGTPIVTAPAGDQSYADTLVALEASIADPASAIAALRRVSILRERLTLATDVAAAQFVEAKATMLTSGAAKGCKLMKAIRSENLGAAWRAELTAGIQDCERQ
jgi:hypothetical protein